MLQWGTVGICNTNTTEGAVLWENSLHVVFIVIITSIEGPEAEAGLKGFINKRGRVGGW